MEAIALSEIGLRLSEADDRMVLAIFLGFRKKELIC